MEYRRIVIAGGCGLAFGAAFTNAGLVFHTGTSVSYLTGDISRLSVDLALFSPGMLAEAAKVGIAALSFFVGAFVAGFFIHHPTLDFSRPYGRTITSIGVMFVAGALLLGRFPLAGIALAACGCGLQNALAAHYRGIVLRTTHLTGLFTDFGVTIGMRLRGHDIPAWKIAVPSLLIVSFFLGGAGAAVVYFKGGLDVILLAGIAYCLSGFCWSLWKRGYLPLPRLLQSNEAPEGTDDRATIHQEEHGQDGV